MRECSAILTGIIVVRMDGAEEAFSTSPPGEWFVDTQADGRLILRCYADKTGPQTQQAQFLPNEWRAWRTFKSAKPIAEAA